MISLRKRGAVYGVIGLMLCVAVYLNWSYFQTPDELTIADQAEASGSVYGAVTAVDNTDTAADASSDGSAKKTRKPIISRRRDCRGRPHGMKRSRCCGKPSLMTAHRRTPKKQASEKITQIAGNTVKEERLESQLKSKGYTDAVVYISEETISVIVSSPKGGLNASSTAAISDMVLSETGAQASMLRVSEAK